MIAAVLQLAGAACEIGGVLLMANLYIGNVRRRQVMAVLLSALVGGVRAWDGVEISYFLSRDNKLASLLGLALIGVGFVLLAAGVLVSALA